MSEFGYSETNIDTIKSGTYDRLEPTLTPLPDGDMLLTYVDGTGISRNALNRTALYYMIYNNEEWSQPQIVGSDYGTRGVAGA